MKERVMTVSEWISVKDGLPENEEFVLVVCGISNQICLAFYEDGTVQEDFSIISFDDNDDDWLEYDEKYDKSYVKRGWYEGNWYSEDFVAIPTEDVKYWMHLPSKPNYSAKMNESEDNTNA